MSLLLLICLTARSIAGRIPALFHPLSVVLTSMNPPMYRTDFSEAAIFIRMHTKPFIINSMMQTPQRAVNSISILIWYAVARTRLIIYSANRVHLRPPAPASVAKKIGLNYFAHKALWAGQMTLVLIINPAIILTLALSLYNESRAQLNRHFFISTCSRTRSSIWRLCKRKVYSFFFFFWFSKTTTASRPAFLRESFTFSNLVFTCKLKLSMMQTSFRQDTSM